MDIVRRLLRPAASSAVVAAAAAAAVLAAGTGVAQAGTSSCGTGAHGSGGYAYAGHQGRHPAHGVRATVSATATPSVKAGHVAGWIGVGGPGQGPNGETEWLQAGIASLPGTPTMVYAEITSPGEKPVFLPLVQDVEQGQRFDLAVLEMSGKRDWWRVWLGGRAVTEPIHLPGSHGRWKPIVTAESFDNDQAVCNTFGFRFERVGVARAPGGAWRTFVPGFDFLDRGYAVRRLRPVAGDTLRTLAADPIQPYAFDAVSAG